MVRLQLTNRLAQMPVRLGGVCSSVCQPWVPSVCAKFAALWDVEAGCGVYNTCPPLCTACGGCFNLLTSSADPAATGSTYMRVVRHEGTSCVSCSASALYCMPVWLVRINIAAALRET